MLITLFGTNKMMAFSESQIAASNTEEPKYQWTIPLVTSMGGPVSIAPDNSIFFASTTYNAIVRCFVQQTDGSLLIYRMASSPAGTTSPGMDALLESFERVERFALVCFEHAGQHDACVRNSRRVHGLQQFERHLLRFRRQFVVGHDHSSKVFGRERDGSSGRARERREHHRFQLAEHGTADRGFFRRKHLEDALRGRGRSPHAERGRHRSDRRRRSE
jgi:hypothetical protein